jgi:lysozyme family protein
MASFTIAVTKTLEHEGGYTPGLPGDPGGETNFGISKAAYSNMDIAGLTRQDAINIYQKDFWYPLYDQLESQGLANQLFDFGVNAGSKTAVKVLQAGLGATQDGLFGPGTLQAANSSPNAPEGFCVARIRHYASLGNFSRFAASWVRRSLDY